MRRDVTGREGEVAQGAGEREGREPDGGRIWGAGEGAGWPQVGGPKDWGGKAGKGRWKGLKTGFGEGAKRGRSKPRYS